MKTAAAATGATFVNPAPASEGHDVCSADPWINGIHTDTERAMAVHPFLVEQQAVARLIANRLN